MVHETRTGETLTLGLQLPVAIFIGTGLVVNAIGMGQNQGLLESVMLYGICTSNRPVQQVVDQLVQQVKGCTQ